MASEADSEQELLEAESRRLTARGYTLYRGDSDLLPPSLRSFQPDAIALGREPKYVIEIVRDGTGEVDKLTRLRRLLADLPGWELLVVLDRGIRTPELKPASLDKIDAALDSVRKVIALGELAPGLLLAWGIFEAISRILIPHQFGRPQTPGRLIQTLAAGGHLDISQEQLLRKLAKVRNAVIHGELSEAVQRRDAQGFVTLLDSLRSRIDGAKADLA